MELNGREITVVGAGIAGLAAALALSRQGAVVTVLEQAEAVREFGAGFQITPNGARVLEGLGLAKPLSALSLLSHGVEIIDGPTGRRVIRLDLARLRPREPHRFVRRPDLIALLFDAVREAGVTLRLNARVLAADVTGQTVRLNLAGGETHEAHLLIGADGIHSPVRAAVEGEDSTQPFFTGQVAWRAVVRGEAEPVAQVHTGPGRHLVTYPLPRGLRNIVAVEERASWAAEDWRAVDDPANLRAAFAGFAPPVRRLLAEVDEVHLWGLFRHGLVQHWHRGAAIVIGDAAHPTLPFLAQGANMALEDAWLIAATLAAAPDAEQGFSDFVRLRRARVSRLVAAANANARNYHLTGASRQAAHMVLRVGGMLAPSAAIGRFDWIYRYDPVGASRMGG